MPPTREPRPFTPEESELLDEIEDACKTVAAYFDGHAEQARNPDGTADFEIQIPATHTDLYALEEELRRTLPEDPRVWVRVGSTFTSKSTGSVFDFEPVEPEEEAEEEEIDTETSDYYMYGPADIVETDLRMVVQGAVPLLTSPRRARQLANAFLGYTGKEGIRDRMSAYTPDTLVITVIFWPYPGVPDRK